MRGNKKTTLWLAVVGSVLVMAAAHPNNDKTATALEKFEARAYAEAIPAFQTALGAQAEWAEGHAKLGHCFYMTGNAARGRASIEQAYELDRGTDRFSIYFAAGNELFRQGDHSEAIAPFEQALVHAGEVQQRRTLLRLAQAALRADRPAYTRELLTGPHGSRTLDAPGRYYMALACQALGDYDCALSQLQPLTEQPGELHDSAVITLARWSAHWALHPSNRARRDQLLETALTANRGWYDANPNNPDAAANYASVLMAANRREEAAELLMFVVRQAEDGL